MVKHPAEVFIKLAEIEFLESRLITFKKEGSENESVHTEFLSEISEQDIKSFFP